MGAADWQGAQGSAQWLDFSALRGADGGLRLSYLAWLVAEWVEKRMNCGLNLPGEVIEPDAGPAPGERCLRALAVWGEKPPRDHDALPFGTRQDLDVDTVGGPV